MTTLEVACFQSEPNKEFVPQEEGADLIQRRKGQMSSGE